MADGSLRSELGRRHIAVPVMNGYLSHSRDPRLSHGGVGGANSMTQRDWRCSRRYPQGTDAVVLPA
jgi:hypothetical protein